MKKILTVLLALAVLSSSFLLWGCSSEANPEPQPSEDIVTQEYPDDIVTQESPEDTTELTDDADAPSGHESGLGQEDDRTFPRAEALKSEVTTIDEAIDYLDNRFPELWMSAHFNNGQDDIYWLRSGEEILEDEEFNEAGRSCIANAAAYLLSDDMDISTVICFWNDGMEGGPLKAINRIRTDDGYEFVDIAKKMSGDEMSRYGGLLPEGRYASMDEYVSDVFSGSDEQLFSLYVFEGGQKFIFRMRQDGWVTMLSPAAEPVYAEQSRYITDEELEERLYGHIKPENIGNYQLSGVLGGVTLTAEDARSLVDASPEEAKEKVRTAADVLMYMLAARVGDCGGCKCDQWDGYTWHTNLTAKEVMEQRLANCGASANLANYLLEGDYEDIGFILHAYYPGNGGGHVYNYILHEGKYYIVDLSWYIFAGYDVSNDFPVMVLDSLEQYGQRVNELYGGVCLVLAHTSTGQHLPNIFGDDFGDPHYFVPEGAEYSVLYESGDGFLIGEMPLDKKYHDWNEFW